MQHLLQWPVIIFAGMSLSFAVVVLAVSVLDRRQA